MYVSRHNALNRRACGQSALPLYLLIELLEMEVRVTNIAVRVVSSEKLPGHSASVIEMFKEIHWVSGNRRKNVK